MTPSTGRDLANLHERCEFSGLGACDSILVLAGSLPQVLFPTIAEECRLVSRWWGSCNLIFSYGISFRRFSALQVRYSTSV